MNDLPKKITFEDLDSRSCEGQEIQDQDGVVLAKFSFRQYKYEIRIWQEICKRYNQHEQLVEALEKIAYYHEYVFFRI